MNFENFFHSSPQSLSGITKKNFRPIKTYPCIIYSSLNYRPFCLFAAYFLYSIMEVDAQLGMLTVFGLII